MCLPNCFRKLFSNNADPTASSPNRQSSLHQHDSQAISQSQMESINRRTSSSSQLYKQQQQQQQPNSLTPQKSERGLFNGLFNKKKPVQRKARSRSFMGNPGVNQKKKAFGNIDQKAAAAAKANEMKMKKHPPSMQRDLNRGGFKAHALMNKPPPSDINAAKKSKQKVENTISISVHQPVDSDSDADILNTDKNPKSPPKKKKPQQQQQQQVQQQPAKPPSPPPPTDAFQSTQLQPSSPAPCTHKQPEQPQHQQSPQQQQQHLPNSQPPPQADQTQEMEAAYKVTKQKAEITTAVAVPLHVESESDGELLATDKNETSDSKRSTQPASLSPPE